MRLEPENWITSDSVSYLNLILKKSYYSLTDVLNSVLTVSNTCLKYIKLPSESCLNINDVLNSVVNQSSNV